MARKASAALVAGLMIPMVAACGVIGDKSKSGSNDAGGSNSGLGDAGATAKQGDAPAGGQAVDINKTVWYSGMKLTFGKLTYDPAKEYPAAKLSIDTTVENVSPTGVQGSPSFTIKVNGNFVDGHFTTDFGKVPAGETGKTTVDFRADQDPGDLSAAELQVGDSESVQAIVPLGSAGQLVDLAPKELLDKPVSKSTKTGKVTWNKCSLEADLPSDHQQVEKDMRTVVCYLDMQQTVAKAAGEAVNQGNFILRVPDGSVVAADKGPIEAFYHRLKITDTEIVFKIRWPAPGGYKMEVEFGDGTSALPLTIS
jgi:hypothetical protein